jgi:hypothetical protein
MEKRIIHARADGGVSVVAPVVSVDDPETMTEAEAVARALALLPPETTGPAVIDAVELPQDPSFREAWRLSVPVADGEAEEAAGVRGRIIIDMERAREIHMDRIRRARDVELAKLDIDFMRAIEIGDLDEQAEIALHKQRLRDTPQTFDLSGYATPEELKEAWPVDLDRPAD